MGHSIQCFRGKSIVLDDADVFATVNFAAHSSRATEKSEKLSELINGWEHQLEISGPGTIDLELDHYLQTSDDINEFSIFLNGFRQRVDSFGDDIPVEILQRSVPMGIVLKDPYPAHLIISTLIELERLVRQ
jgi:hypothetical protein